MIYFTGGAGVGKTFLINLLAKWCEWILRKPGDNPLKPKILLMAHTGIAAHLINGTTLHTALGFKFGGRKYLPLRDSRLEYFRSSFEELEVIIMDELSMISADQLYDVHRRLEDILISKDLFGARSVILVGDIMQLPPVKGRPIYSKPYNQKNLSLWNSSDNIWKNFEVVTLKVSQRQKANVWRECLNRIRVGELNPEDKKLLDTRRLKRFPNLQVDEACHVFYTNLEVDDHNMKMLNALPDDLVHVKSEGLYPKGYRLMTTPHGTIEDTPLRKDLYLKKGSRIMLTFNVNLSDGLVNGSLGTVIDFISDSTKVKAVVIVFDDESSGEQQRREHQKDSAPYEKQKGTPIYKLDLEHLLKGSLRSMKSHGARGTTSQFPLRLSWASTCHKLQGITIKEGSNLIVHGNKKKKIPKNMFYVMFSRCASLDNLYLDENVNFDEIQCDEAALQEKLRLDKESLGVELEEEKIDLFFVNIRSYMKHREDLSKDVFAKRSECLCLVETWMQADDLSLHEESDKAVYHASISRGKGCCAFVPQDCEHICSLVYEYYQIVSFKYKENYQVVLVYQSKDAIKHHVKQSLASLLLPSLKHLVIGDFNFDAGESNEVSRYLEKCNLTQVVKGPTQKEGRTIDQFYVPTELKECFEIKVQFKYYSDHAGLQIKFKN